MKAIVCKKEKINSNLLVTELPLPVLKNSEILVKVKASTLNTGDVARIKMGLIPSKKPITGSEFSGVVEQIGSEIKDFKIGDHVFGCLSSGAHTEYISVSFKDIILKMPKIIDFNEAASIPNGALAAYFFLQKAKASEKKEILINGATGSVGSFAVQIAKQLGLYVTAVSSEKNRKMLYLLGADEVLDYTNPNFKNQIVKQDIIFDAVGKLNINESTKWLKNDGVFVTTQLNVNVGLAKIWSLFSPYKIVFGIAKHNQKDFSFISDLIQSKKITTVIDTVYPIEEIEKAFDYVESGRKTGNVVIKFA